MLFELDVIKEYRRILWGNGKIIVIMIFNKKEAYKITRNRFLSIKILL